MEEDASSTSSSSEFEKVSTRRSSSTGSDADENTDSSSDIKDFTMVSKKMNVKKGSNPEAGYFWGVLNPFKDFYTYLLPNKSETAQDVANVDDFAKAVSDDVGVRQPSTEEAVSDEGSDTDFVKVGENITKQETLTREAFIKAVVSGERDMIYSETKFADYPKGKVCGPPVELVDYDPSCKKQWEEYLKMMKNLDADSSQSYSVYMMLDVKKLIRSHDVASFAEAILYVFFEKEDERIIERCSREARKTGEIDESDNEHVNVMQEFRKNKVIVIVLNLVKKLRFIEALLCKSLYACMLDGEKTRDPLLNLREIMEEVYLQKTGTGLLEWTRQKNAPGYFYCISCYDSE